MYIPSALIAVLGFALVLFAAACSTADLEPEAERFTLPGEIRHEMAVHHDARVDIDGFTVTGPPLLLYDVEVYESTVEVQAGVPFDVTVHTLAARNCHQVETSEVVIRDQEAVISVFDSLPNPPGENLCPAVLILLPRTDQVVFDAPGEAEVVIRGYKISAGRHPYELRFPVLVVE